MSHANISEIKISSPVLERIMRHIIIWAHSTLQLAYFVSDLLNCPNPSTRSAAHDF